MSIKPVDKYVGSRLRVLRKSAGLTQTQLARRIGVKFQQLQKYETGANRVSASRLVLLARALDVSIAELFGKYSGSSSFTDFDDASFRGRWVARFVKKVSALDDDTRASVFALVDSVWKVSRRSGRRASR